MLSKFPDEALKNHIAVLAKTGAGKSYAVRGIVEGLLDQGARVCIIDPTGAWHGLRSSASGKSAGYPVVIFGGEYKDLELSYQAGEAIAEVIGASSTPAILDTSMMTIRARTTFFAEFADALMRKNKGPLHLVIDEAHLFAPQGKVNSPQAGEMLSAANNLVSLGRSRGLRVIMISQRPAKLHKDSLTQCETMIALRLIAPQDRNAVREWIEDNADRAKGQEIVSSLATLKTGNGWVWAPELGILDRIVFPKIKTFDSGKAPDGADAKRQVMAPIDVQAVSERLKSVNAEALVNDPAQLKRRIAELEKKLRDAPATVDTSAIEQRADRAGYVRGFQEGSEAVIKRVSESMASIPMPSQKTRATIMKPAKRVSDERTRVASSGISAPRQKILDQLAWLESLDMHPAPKATLAAVCGVSPKSGGYFNNLGALRALGAIDYPQPGMVGFTQNGRAAANPLQLNDRTIQECWLDIVSVPQRAILAALLENHPQSMDKKELAERLGISPTSGGYFNNLGRLRTLGAIDYPTPGQVALTRYVTG